MNTNMNTNQTGDWPPLTPFPDITIPWNPYHYNPYPYIPQWPAYVDPQQGWQCPLCKMVYSPSIYSCDCDKVKETEDSSTK